MFPVTFIMQTSLGMTEILSKAKKKSLKSITKNEKNKYTCYVQIKYTKIHIRATLRMGDDKMISASFNLIYKQFVGDWRV